jgi:uncharacterized protein YyaL (SSP411 family)
MPGPQSPAPQHLTHPANRLAEEKSPYLLQHAHNPVDWYPWGLEALETARRDNKPIFLSIGYSACHWCHVMAHESFEDEGIGALLKEHFISIKVDREERPDVDEIYMTAVQMMTGQGGWPLSVFLLPDGRPFYGGTYFPPDNRGGRISFRSLISQLAHAVQHRYFELEDVASQLTQELQTATRQRPVSGAPNTATADSLLKAALVDMTERADAANGGFGGAPKFPPHHALRLLLRGAEREETDALPMLLVTLERMALGGIYDHIGGGFHRYATDAVWLLPHFEKMLYDNALLARVYADAYRLTGRVAFARVARETCDWVLRDMVDDAGGFHSALDADSEGVEGKYYVWSQEEVLERLGADTSRAFCERYHFRPEGNYREEATGHQTGLNIPYLALGPSGVALPDVLEDSQRESRGALLQSRYKRVPPAKDNKVLTSWNGLMIGALAFCGNVLNEPGYIAAAERAANFCLTTLRPEGALLHRYARGEAAIPAFLDDYAYLADGLLDIYEVTKRQDWLIEAQGLMDTLLSDFWDKEDTGFFFSGQEHEQLIARSKELFDGALPSANGIAARVSVRLGNLPEGDRFRKAAEMFLYNYRGLLQRAPHGTCTLVETALLAEASGGNATATMPVQLTAEVTPLTVAPGEHLVLNFTLRLAPGYHVNSHRPPLPHLIATQGTVTFDIPATVGPLSYPEPEMLTIAGESLPVYTGNAVFSIPVRIAEDAADFAGFVGLSVRYQPCSETACLAPETLTTAVEVKMP